MSMSQEEIEALMNGLDIGDDEEEEVSQPGINTKEIEALLSQTEELENINKTKNDKEEFSTQIMDNSEIENLLKDIESNNFVEETSVKEVKNIEKEITPEYVYDEKEKEELGKNWTSTKIEEGIFPYPADKDTKVVNQLSQVANDSEEKVSQIFDVLSLALDNNAQMNKNLKDIESFILVQSQLLKSLNNKFPNINVFDQHLSKVDNILTIVKDSKTTIAEEDMRIFEGMELMQFNDINRQKIERVMAVIRKLSIYLNNIFEDDGSSKEVSIAKHIHGDSNDDLVGDDLDKLIADFESKRN